MVVFNRKLYLEKVVPEIGSANHLLCKSMGWFLCNGDIDLKWQR